MDESCRAKMRRTFTTAALCLFFILTSAGRERWLFLGNSITQAGHYVDYIETWYLLNESDAPEIIDLGLSSETVSGLSEPEHPFPRPCLHTRLDRVLDRVEPDLVVACYGMNCGIYHPFSEERFQAYKEGIKKLAEKVHAYGAELILLTPPPFAGRVKPRQPPSEGEAYGFRYPASDYNKTLARYAEWLLSLDGRSGIRVLDIRPGLETFMEQSYPNEPVHPSPFGHKLMAESFLQGLGIATGSDLLETGIDPREEDQHWTSLSGLVRKQRETYDRSLLNDIGHGNPGVMERFTTPLSDAEKLVIPVNQSIDSLLRIAQLQDGNYALPAHLPQPLSGAWGFPDPPGDFDLLAEFRDPPEGYGPVPFYWWVGEKLTRERLLWQLEELDKAGTQGLCVSYPHSHVLSDPDLNADGHGMFGLTYPSDPAFFSEEWWKLWNWFTGECARRSIGLGLDDYTFVSPGNKRWPDEIAALPEMNNYRGKLLFREPVTVPGGQEVHLKISDSTLALSAIPLSKGQGSPETVDLLNFAKGSPGLNWTAPEGNRWMVVQIDLGKNFMLHPNHGKEVIAHYFQKFEDHVDPVNQLGMNYFFQDELHVDLGPDTWSEDFADQFIQLKGYDIRPHLAALKYDIGPLTPKVRLDYADVVSLLAEERYFQPIFQWHWERGKTFGCDNWGRGLNPVAYVDYFRATRWFGAPGNDAPQGATALVQTKVSSSISHLYQRPRVWLEAFHSMGWGASPEMFTEATDRHYLLGGNLLCLHGLYYTTLGGWWEWAPPDFHFRMPYWPHLSAWLRSIERQSYLLSQGRHVCDVAIIYPASPMHADPGIQSRAFRAAHELYEAGIDFDFIDYQSLSRAEIRDGRIHVSGESYRVLIMDDMEAVRFASLKKAEELYQNGGIVVALKTLPGASDRMGRDDPILDSIETEIFGLSSMQAELTGRKVEKNNDAGGKAIFTPVHDGLGDLIKGNITCDFLPSGGKGHVQHRKIGDRDVYMIMDVPKGTECFFRAKGKAEVWDVLTGGTREIPVIRVTDEGTFLRIPVDPPRSCFIVFSSGTPVLDKQEYAGTRDKKVITLDGKWECRFEPTMDNRWGDFRIPASDEIIGPEAREMRYITKKKTTEGWQEAAFDDSQWEMVTCDFGPRMWQMYTSSGEDVEHLSREIMENPDLHRGMTPYSFSWRWGVENQPGSQGYHGLKGKLSDQFLIMGKKGYYLYSTHVNVKKTGNYRLITEGLDPLGIGVDGKEVQKTPLKLKKGMHHLVAWYYNPESKEGPSGAHPIDLRNRASVVLCREDVAIKERQPLSMIWHGQEGRPEYDLSAGCKEVGCYRFIAPPGLHKLRFAAHGEVEIWCNGNKTGITQTGTRNDGARLYEALMDTPVREISTIAIRVVHDPGHYGGAAFPEPVKLDCGKGQISEGDWSDMGVLKHYSGGIRYGRTFSLTSDQLKGQSTLDLGRVGATCEVHLNGKYVGTEIAPPYRFDISEHLEEGDNRLEILVYNTLANHYQSVPTPDFYKKPAASGLLDTVRIINQ